MVVDRVYIGYEAIRADLETVFVVIDRCRVAHLPDEILGVDAVASAQMPGDHELGVALDSDESVGVADHFHVLLFRALVALFLADVSPNLVKLEILNLHVADPRT